MGRFILKRFLYTLPVLWGVTVVVFLLVRILPGDIANYILGSGADPAAIAAPAIPSIPRTGPMAP